MMAKYLILVLLFLGFCSGQGNNDWRFSRFKKIEHDQLAEAGISQLPCAGMPLDARYGRWSCFIYNLKGVILVGHNETSCLFCDPAGLEPLVDVLTVKVSWMFRKGPQHPIVVTPYGQYEPNLEQVPITVAKAMCILKGGYLADFETQQEHDALTLPVSSVLWIGGHDFYHNGTYYWNRTRTALDFSYLQWGSGKPSALNRQPFCMFTVLMEMHNVVCEGPTYGYLCEY